MQQVENFFGRSAEGFMKTSLLLMAVAGAALGAQSISLQNTAATFKIPNTAAFAALTSPGSYWIDVRVTSWGYPDTSCQNVVQLPGGDRALQIRICAPSLMISPFGVDPGSDRSNVYFGVAPPNIAIASATATNPATVTLASAPFPITMSPGKTVTIFKNSCAGMNRNHRVLAVSGNTLTLDYDGSACSAPAGGTLYSQDFVFRFHRDLTLGELIAESWNVDGTGYNKTEAPLTSSATLPGASSSASIGPGPVSLAFFRWHTGTIPINARAPWGGSANAGGTILADWEFEGNADDLGPNHVNLPFNPAPVYQPTPVYAPACDAGAQRSFRAGTRGTLESRSFPLDGGDRLTYLWQQLPSDAEGTPQQRVQWTNRGTATPAISGFVAGPLNFKLTVTDGSGLTSSCSVHHGAVATDDAGNVALPDPKVSNIIGPLIQWGHPNATWPFFDQSSKLWADLMGSLLGKTTGRSVPDRTDGWDTAEPGTVSATYGDLRIYGTGTSFRATFCNGGKYAAPGRDTILFWYPNPAIPRGFGRRMRGVGKCVSDTILDLQIAWSDDDGSSSTAYNVDAPPGFTYTAGQTLSWRPAVSCAGGPTTINVNGLGPAPLKKADGITDPAAADCVQKSKPSVGIRLVYNGKAMTIQGVATNEWLIWKDLPGTTSGMQYSVWLGSNSASWAGFVTNINFYDNVAAFYTMYYRTGIDTYLNNARWLADRWWSMPWHDSGYSDGTIGPNHASMTGLFLRAIDQDNLAGTPGASPMWAGLRTEVDRWNRGDIRRDSTNGQIVGDIRETGYSYAAVAMCAAYFPDPAYAATCRADVNTAMTKIWSRLRQPDGSWQGIYGTDIAVPNNWIGANSSGTVTVTPGSTTVTLTGGSFRAEHFPQRFLTVADPWDVSTRDSGYYNATYVDPTQLQLDRPYSDACAPRCSGRMWVAGQGWVGFGTQPFMMGILGQFFHQARIALSMDPQYDSSAALAKSYLQDVVHWVTTKGVQSSRRGLWYGVGIGVCAGPNPAEPSCASPDVGQTRSLNGEALGTLAIGYLDNPDPAVKARIDNLFAAVYAKYPTDPGYDGIYETAMDQLGYNYVDQNPKWLGFFYGVGRNAAWPSARQGGLRKEQPTTVYVNAVPGRRDAAKVQLIITDPTGVDRPPVTCDSMPCAVTVNRALGNPIARMAYLSADGKVLGYGERFEVPVN